VIVDHLLKVAQLGSTWVLYLLLGLSVLSIGVMVERWLYFSSVRDRGRTLRAFVAARLRDGDLAGAERALEASRSIEARVVKNALGWRHGGARAVSDAIDSELAEAKHELERNLNFLGTLGNNAPFIGLFGTVLGIIRAFHDLAGSSLQGTSAVMSGIAEALVATGVGLLVALPSVAVYNVLIRHVETTTSGSEAVAREILAYLKTEKKEAA